jgi:hypothetical protein
MTQDNCSDQQDKEDQAFDDDDFSGDEDHRVFLEFCERIFSN